MVERFDRQRMIGVAEVWDGEGKAMDV